MQKATLFIATLALLLASHTTANAANLIETTRFGYQGTVKEYSTLADAQAGENQVGSDIAIGNRDLALEIRTDAFGQVDQVALQTAWFYTTDPSGKNGAGNPSNTRVGFVQLVDTDGSTLSTSSMNFADFDGTYWTEFNASLSGSGANPSQDFARLGVLSSPGYTDGGIYHEYDLSLTATGLTGTESSPGFIESLTQPTGVSGSFSGVYENIRAPAPIFYTFDYQLNMDSWAWDNQDDFTGSAFADSTFAIPEPTTALIMAGSGLALMFRRRRKVA